MEQIDQSECIIEVVNVCVSSKDGCDCIIGCDHVSVLWLAREHYHCQRIMKEVDVFV